MNRGRGRYTSGRGRATGLFRAGIATLTSVWETRRVQNVAN